MSNNDHEFLRYSENLSFFRNFNKKSLSIRNTRKGNDTGNFLNPVARPGVFVFLYHIIETTLYTTIPNLGNEWQQASNDASCPAVTYEMVL